MRQRNNIVFFTISVAVLILYLLFVNIFILHTFSNQQSLMGIVKQISPDKGTSLEPNKRQTFTFTFIRPVNPNTIKVNLQEKNISLNSKYTNVLFTQKYTNNDTALLVTLNENVLSFHDYDLSLVDNTSQTTVFDAAYLGGLLSPTPFPKNNLSLVKFLPLQKSSYLFYYSRSLNAYVFIFLYNDKSSQPADVQYQIATDDLTKFIQSKGIDPATLSIYYKN